MSTRVKNQDSSMSRKKSSQVKTSNEKSSHLDPHMMLSSQLLSTGRFNEGLPAFITRALDAEQVWQQLELRNLHKMSIAACTREVINIQSSLSLREKKMKKKRLKQSAAKSSSDQDGIEDVSGSGSDSDENMLESIKRRLAEQPGKKDGDFEFGDDSEDDGLDFDFEMEKEISKGLSDDNDEELQDGLNLSHRKSVKTKEANKIATKTSIVDDKFFKLAEMEQFLDLEDKKEEKRRKREDTKNYKEEESEDDDDDEVDDEVDMFADLNDEDEEEDALNARYSDFFDPPKDGQSNVKEKVSAHTQDDGEESENDMEADSGEAEDDDESDIEDEDEDDDGEEHIVDGNKKSQKAVSFDQELLLGDDDVEDGDEDEKSFPKEKSTFEKRQEQLQAQAREMEEKSLKEASWELTGEATATKRPENSLLETVLDFQHTTKAAPVITDETTKTLEDFIKQRIKDKAFDDVERKVKPKEDSFEFKKRIVLDQEKSKMSLGELYEQEFLKQQQHDKEEVKADPECEKVEKDLKKLFQQLDALCNFRYTPMQAGTEVKIIVNTPAITMEEVAPTATTDTQLLAPEEVKEKIRGELKATDEMEATDKKRQRREKKKEKRERKKDKEAREKLVEKMKPGLGNKYSKAKAIKKLEQISKTDRNVTMIKGDNQKLTSSTSFFNQLQEEVQTNARAKKSVKTKKKSKVLDASKIML